MKKNLKKFLAKNLLINLFAVFFLIVPNSALAQSQQEVCAYLNNQSAGAATTQSDSAGNTTEGPFVGKFITITEEPLGTPDGKFSFRCVRETKCLKTNDQTNCVSKYIEPNTCAASELVDGEFTNCENVQVYLASAGTDLLYHYIGLVYRYIATIGGMLAVFIMIYSGIQIAASGANDGILTKAKEKIYRCIMGLILLFMTSIILYVINPNFFVY